MLLGALPTMTDMPGVLAMYREVFCLLCLV